MIAAIDDSLEDDHANALGQRNSCLYPTKMCLCSVPHLE